MKLSDVKREYIDDIMEQGLAQTRSQAEQLFAEALTRNLVSVEIMGMCRYIAEEKKA